MKKIVIPILIIIAIITTIIIATITSTNDNDLPTIKVSEVTRSIFYAPQYIAIENGYFEEEGFRLDLITNSGADTVMTAVLANQVDIGFAGPESAIYVYNEGMDDYPIVFAGLTKKDGSFLVSKDYYEDFTWDDLLDKTVIPGRKGGVPYMTFDYVLKTNGINSSTDLIFDDSISFDLMAGAFAAGTGDFVTLFEPTASLTQIQKQGYIVTSIGEAAGELPYTTYFAKQSYIAENEDIIQGFTNAIYKAQQWLENNTAIEAANIIQGYFPDTDIDLIATVIENYKEIEAYSLNPVITEDSFDRLQDIMISAGELDKKIPFDSIITNSYANKSIE